MAARAVYCLVLLLLLWGGILSAQVEDAQREEKCEELCAKNQGMGTTLETKCDDGCRAYQCNRGCSGQNRSLESSCKHFCIAHDSRSAHVGRWYCVIGCNIAVSRYVQRLRDELRLEAPTLVPDSLTHDSVTIRWMSPQLPHATLLVQYKYSDLPGEWTFYQPDVKLNTSQVTITGLEPYTKYQFRVLWAVAADQEPLPGAASVPISTLAHGRPASAPTQLSASAPDAQHVAVSWWPPLFPAGPLTSYLVVLETAERRAAAVAEVAAHLGSHVLGELRPSTNYTVRVSANNKAGEGPVAETWVQTPPLAAEVSTQRRPQLIIGTGDVIMRLEMDIFSSPKILYNADDGTSIAGTALDVAAGRLYAATSAGRVWRLELADGADREPADITPARLAGRPTLLALDWLAGVLYALVAPPGGGWAVQRWTLDGAPALDTGLSFSARPAHLAVDPQNGYLYYSVAAPGPKAGLFRCSFDNMTAVERVATGDDLNFSTFVIDHTNFSVLVPGRSQNTVFALSMISWTRTDIRRDTVSPQYAGMLALAEHAGTLCWSTGQHVYLESYRADRGLFYNNRFMLSHTHQPVFSLHVLHARSQPRPAPAGPPRQLQAVFHSGRALARWQAPELPGLAGPAAWEQWTYQLRISDTGAGHERTVDNITGTEVTVQGLSPDTQYMLEVRALSVSGVGPWSAPFQGRTLEHHLNASGPFLLWSTEIGLLRSDVIGDRPTVLVSRASFNASGKSNIHVSDLTWNGDVMYLATNDSRVYSHDLSSGQLRQLDDSIQATALAVDWIGKKLYWSNPVQQLIYGSSLTGDVTEGTPLPFVTAARHLRVDALSGVLYWSTGHSVEASYLNGERRRHLFQAGIFSGKQVVGLTLDLVGRRLFWIVREFSGSTLHMLPLLDSLDGDGAAVEKTTVIPSKHKHVKGPLHFFSGRLLWVMDDESAVIADPDAAHLAVINAAGVSGLRMVAVLDDALHPLPAGYAAHQLTVLPQRVPAASVALSAGGGGDGDGVTVRWAAVNVSSYATVTYRVELNGRPATAAGPRAQLAGRLPAFSPVQVALRAVTRWGESPLTRVTLHTPEGTPSEPLRVRVFTRLERPIVDAQNWTAVVRWDAPETPAGVIRQYHLTVRQERPSSALLRNVSVSGNDTEALLTDLSHTSIYQTEVVAETSAGVGRRSDPLAFQPRDRPVPRLLAADADRLRLLDLDSDRVTDLLTQERVIDLDMDARQRRLFVLTADNDILSLDLQTLEKHKVESLRGSGTSLTYDWIGRNIYWAESDSMQRYSAIYRLNLDTEVSERASERVAGHTGLIYRLRVDPWTSRLVWTMVGPDGATILMSPARDGSTIGPFFGAGQSSDSCTCPASSSDGHLVALDGRQRAERRLLWWLAGSGRLMAADMDGCRCQPLAAVPKHDGVVAVSDGAVFWAHNSSSSESSVVSLRLGPSGERRQVYSGRTVRGLWPLDGRVQQFPPAHCLLPGPPTGRPRATDNRASSVTVQMSPPSPPADCGPVSAAEPRYMLHYGPAAGKNQCREHLRFCQNTTYVGGEARLTGLSPLTAYTVRVSVSNYYSDLLDVHVPPNTSITVLTTAPAPTEPRQVHAEPLSPEGIEVRWLPPLSSGDRLSYRVHWRTEGVSGSLRAYGPEAVSDTSTAPRPYRLLVPDLIADTEYHIWVSAHSSDGSAASNSSIVSAATYPYPENITLVYSNISNIVVSWRQTLDGAINGSWLEYRPSSQSNGWLNSSLSQAETIGGVATSRYLADGLQARTQYRFRLRLRYRSGQLFFWPADARFTFVTAGGRPDEPSPPEVRVLQGSVYQVMWQPPPSNGASIDLYGLEVDSAGRRARRGTGHQWRLVYNGSDPSWIISGLDPAPNYRFRTRAHNAYGWSDYSAASRPYHLESMPLTAQPSDTGVVVGGVVSAAFLVIVVVVVFLVLRFRQRPEDKKAPRSPDQLPHDVELAQLREIPAHFVRQNNALYAPPFADEDEAGSLPRVRREHITLTKFLGKGAFGEVYEGLAQQLPGREDDEEGCRVAIKTLAKGAKDEEKIEFLKEAQLMCNFRHKHIISLLGVCLDNDPYFLLLELMEGGDLLSYLRANRGTDSDGTPFLSLNDLLQMCVDVARGCQYLEQLHFVHRDLAARNCLVTSCDPQRRLVKIGDFGLARDIYKSDYYRKEGEGLLPVRWMSPESLIDGVFTSQSDVWAFGVLLWEVMTKGQQPYPARTNLEVLQYVRDGGTLSRPDQCPQQMFELMQHCWEYVGDDRPNFQHCLQCLQQIQVAALSQAPGLVQTGMTVHNAQYARTPGAFDNNAYTADEEGVTEEGGWRRSSSATSGRDSSRLLPADGDADSVFSDSSAAQATLPSRARLRLPQKHKYLQLRYDSDAGYEVPIGCGGEEAAAPPPPPPPPQPHGYQNCGPERPVGSVDDIQFSFDGDPTEARRSVASLLSQISGVAIDVDPGKTSWC